MEKENRIIIFGFSGSGKSTLADMLGARLGRRVIHPSSILRDLLEQRPPDVKGSRAGTGYWESAEGIAAFRQRLTKQRPADLDCDEMLLTELEKGKVIIDSWSLPWLTPLGFKICLRASLATRTQRVAQRSKVSLAQARRAITLKDEQTRKLYQKQRGFDIKLDNGVFDLIIDTEELTIPQICQHILAII